MFASLVDELISSDDDAVVARLRTNELETRRLAAERAAIVLEVERRSLYTVDGHRSTKGFLKAQLNWSNNHVAAARRLAAVCDGVPGVGDAMHDGHISVDHAEELARLFANPRVRDRLAGSIHILLPHAENLAYENFRVVTQRWETINDIDGAHEQQQRRIERRSATVIDLSGELFFQASGGSPLQVAELVAVFDAFVEAEFRVDVNERDACYGPNAPTALLARTDAQRRRDAVQAIFQAAQRAADAKLDIGPVPIVVNVVVSQHDFEHGLAADGLVPPPTDLDEPDIVDRRSETSTGSPLLAHDVVAAAIHGHVRRVVMNTKGVIIDFGRERRLFTGAIRTAAKLMGHRCSHPGCDIPADRCQIDHLEEFVRHNGRTSLANAGLECSSHNRYKHKANLHRTRHGTDWITTDRPDGTPMRPVGQRPSPRMVHGIPITHCRYDNGRVLAVT